jgi:hypothetical protein
MTTTEVENLTFDEFEKRRDELVAAMKEVPAAELAARYVQARTDAKCRDEKMGEQGKTITELQESLAHARERERVLGEKLRAADVAAVNGRANIKSQDESISGLVDDVAAANARAERLRAEAIRNQTALTGAAKLLNDAIAAQRVDDADAGS